MPTLDNLVVRSPRKRVSFTGSAGSNPAVGVILMVKFKVKLKKEYELMKKTNPKKFKKLFSGFFGERIISFNLLLKGVQPTKIAKYHKGKGLEILVGDIAKSLFSQRLTKQERGKREKLLYYLREKRYGLPDFICSNKNKIFFVEAKYGTSELTKSQKKVKERLENMGYSYLTIKLKKGRYFYLERDKWIPFSVDKNQKSLNSFFNKV